MIHRHCGNIVTFYNPQSRGIPEYRVTVVAQRRKSISQCHRSDADSEFNKGIAGCTRVDNLAEE